MARLHPALSTWLDGYQQLVAEQRQRGLEMSPEIARHGLAQLTRDLISRVPPLERVVDTRLQTADRQIPLRLYLPDKAIDRCMVYLHGGGHMCGSIEVYDPICRRLAVECKSAVLAIGYRLAPEHPYPCALRDAAAVLAGLPRLLDSLGVNFPDQVAIAGDSAGGAMAASLVQTIAARLPFNITHQVLIYPGLDYTMTLPSILSNGRGYLLEAERMKWYFNHYFCNHQDRRAASPLYMPLADRMPSTLLVSAGFCPLLDEGLAYCRRLGEAGFHCSNLHFDDMIHAFMNMEDRVPEACDHLYRGIAEFLQSR